MVTQKATAELLDMTPRNLRDVLKKIDIADYKKVTQKFILTKYIRYLRNQAAGRGGDEQQTLTKARTEEAEIKTAKMRLEFHTELGTVIYTEEAASVISLWARQANIDYTQGIHKLISEIQNRYKIKVNKKLVEDIVTPTTDRIKSHAEKLGASLVESINDFPEA